MQLNYAQKGFSTITPFLMVNDADKVLEFVKEAFDAEEGTVLRHEDGSLWHAQLKIGDSMVMLADAMGEDDHVMPASIYVYVKDTDAQYKKAIEAGAESVLEPADQFYGDRNAGVRDPSGNVWWIATKKETLSYEELKKRSKEWELNHKSHCAGQANS